MSYSCERGHLTDSGGKPLQGKKCKARVGPPYKTHECALPRGEQPEPVRCKQCGRGIYVEDWCSFCGARFDLGNWRHLQGLEAARFLRGGGMCPTPSFGNGKEQVRGGLTGTWPDRIAKAKASLTSRQR